METLDLLRYQTDAANAYLIAWASLLVWDWLSMFRKEVEHIWTKKKTPLRIAYVLNRYGTLLLNSAAMFLILSSVSTRECIPLSSCERPFNSRVASQRSAIGCTSSRNSASSTVSCEEYDLNHLPLIDLLT